ncbi:7alpha-cephem-methoxylase P8 chain, partial [Rhizoctonia solani]
MTLVETSVNYFNPPADGSKPYLRAPANVAPVGTPRRNWEPISYTIQAQNIRGQEASSEHKLDTTGFEFHRIPNRADINFDDEADIRERYYAECIENIRSITGASKVVIFDHTLRKSQSSTISVVDNRSPPIKLVHNNQTNESAKQHVYLYIPEPEVPTLLSNRFQILNLWRPIVNPAWQHPLALCDFRTVRPEDHAPFNIKYLNRDDEALAFKYSSEHKWKYLAGMTPEEFVLFKCFDSLQDQATAAFAPHTAIDDSTVPSDAPDRQSIEIYALVFYG